MQDSFKLLKFIKAFIKHSQRIYKTLMAVVDLVTLVTLNMLLFWIAILERLVVALTLGWEWFRVGNVPSFNDLCEGWT